jgi:cyclic pyranopterin phosphate synthase
MPHFTHFNDKGEAQMVNVSEKSITSRKAIASGSVLMNKNTLQMLADGTHKKGNVLLIAKIAAIQAAKKTADLIPLCHPLMLTAIDVDLHIDWEKNAIYIRAICALAGQTGVEMEALTAVSVAGLTIYDMCKAVDKGMVIQNIQLEHKTGGQSGEWERHNQSMSTTAL